MPALSGPGQISEKNRIRPLTARLWGVIRTGSVLMMKKKVSKMLEKGESGWPALDDSGRHQLFFLLQEEQ